VARLAAFQAERRGPWRVSLAKLKAIAAREGPPPDRLSALHRNRIGRRSAALDDGKLERLAKPMGGLRI
jgi:hypothetical protein